jgi:hypothetical protein
MAAGDLPGVCVDVVHGLPLHDHFLEDEQGSGWHIR